MLVSRKTLAVMQTVACPGLSAKPPSRPGAQFTKFRARAAGAILLRGQIRQILANQGIHARIPLGSVPADHRQNLFVHAERNVLHKHSICEAVEVYRTPQPSTRRISYIIRKTRFRVHIRVPMRPVAILSPLDTTALRRQE